MRAETTYRWKAAPGIRRYHAVMDGKQQAVCGELRSWNRTAAGVDTRNTCPKCWKTLDPVPAKA